MSVFTKKEILQEIADILHDWGDGKRTCLTRIECGVCFNLEKAMDKLGFYSINADLLMDMALPDWPHYTGDNDYPVPDHLGIYLSSCDFYNDFFLKSLWTQRHKLRFDLCHHLADWVEEHREDLV